MSFCNLSNNNGIFTLTLASGDGHHYLTAGAITELEKALESVRSSPARGLVTTSRSGSFCDGLDYDGQSKESATQLEHRMAEVVRLLLDLPMPTVAAVCGNATSLGLALALAHDHCVLYKEAVLGFPEARLRRRVPKYAVALVREKIAHLRLRKLLVLKSQTCTGEELAGTWYSAQGATGHRDEVITDALNLLQGVVVGDGSDYAKVRRTMYTQSCAAVSLTISTTKPASDESSSISVNILDDVAVRISNVKRNKEKSTEPLIYQSSTTPMDIRLHIIESITNGFSDKKKVGSGGYGDVYKGVYNGKEIAVKKFRQMPGLDENQFRNELNSLNTVQHPNIVRLVGYCYETRHENVEYNRKFVFCEHIYRVLCFEYLPGGSLDKHIFEESCGHDWCTRYKIIKGICEGLNYLHGWEKPIFHLDLKPGNILLDNNMVPKIADFGLSRLFVGTRTHQTQTCIGTKPYMPPEYIIGGFVSDKNDVFSLGVIIIEIMTGPQGYSKFRDTPTQDRFIDLVHMNWRNRIEATSGYRSEELDQVETCIKTAISCVDTNRNNRPTIAVIVDKLNNTQSVIPELSMQFSQ